jgi:hypothetical protein
VQNGVSNAERQVCDSVPSMEVCSHSVKEIPEECGKEPTMKVLICAMSVRAFVRKNVPLNDESMTLRRIKFFRLNQQDKLPDSSACHNRQ